MAMGPINYFIQSGVIPMYDTGLDAISLPIKLAANLQLPQGTVLGEQTGIDDLWTFSTPGASFTITVDGQTTSSLGSTSTAAQVEAALLALNNLSNSGVQTLTGTATGGSFLLSLGGVQYTSPLAYNATAAQIQTALAALPNIGSGNVVCSGGPLGTSAVTVKFQGELAGKYILPLGVQQAGTLTGGSVTQATLSNGGGDIVSVTGGPLGTAAITMRFSNSTSNTVSVTGGTGTLTHTQTGTAGSPGTYAAYGVNNTDGTQYPKCVLQFDCATDASGNITFGWQTGGQGAGAFGQTSTMCPAWFKGDFKMSDLVGVDYNLLNSQGWRLLSGNMDNPSTSVVRVG